MDFKTFVHLVYIEGYSYWNECNVTQYGFTKRMLEESVDDASKIDIDENTLRGYIGGNPYHTLSKQMIDAGVNKNRIKSFFETIYDTKHRNTKTFNKRYHGQTYKTALYEKASNEKEGGRKIFPNLMLVNMSDVLAEIFFNMFHDDLSGHPTTAQPSAEIIHNAAVDRYTIDENEKAAIINSCGLVLQELKDIKRMTDSIDKIQRELKDPSSSELWREHLRYELNHLTSRLENRYFALSDLCSDLIALLEPPKHLHKSMAKLSETAHKLIEDSAKFKITSEDGFRYNALVLALSDFESHFNRLKRDWNTV